MARGADAVAGTLRFSCRRPSTRRRQELRLTQRALTICTRPRGSRGAGADRAASTLSRLPACPRRLAARVPRGAPTGERAARPARRSPRGRAAPLRDRTFDDGYDALGASPRFALSGGGRTIAVRFLHGCQVAQVFAPAALDVVCFEPMTAPVNALVSGEGLRAVSGAESFSAAFEISVSG